MRDQSLVNAPDLKLGKLRMAPSSWSASWNGAPVALQPGVYRLVFALASQPDRLRTRSMLIDSLYDGVSDEPFDRAIDTYVRRARAAFRRVDASFEAIRTVYGLGYLWQGGHA